MGHEFVSGFFTREPAWHELGTVLDEAPDNWEKALEVSGLNWPVQKKPLFHVDADAGNVETGMFGLIKGDDLGFLGVCSERYNPWQNADALRWTAPFIESGKYFYEAAGALRGNKICWALLNQGETSIVPGDTLKQHILVTWGHDGQTPITVTPTSIRVVCMNTLRASLTENKTDKFFVRITHKGNVPLKMDEVYQVYSESEYLFNTQAEKFRSWAQVMVDDQTIEKLVNDVFEFDSDVEKLKTESRNNRDMLISKAKISSGTNELEINGSLYNVVMGLNEGIEHYLGGKRVKDRGDYVLNGKGAELNKRLFAYADELVAV